MFAMSYMIVILYTWIRSAIFHGDVYFSAGEPIEIIRNIEWAGGLISIVILIGMAKENIDEDIVEYDEVKIRNVMIMQNSPVQTWEIQVEQA